MIWSVVSKEEMEGCTTSPVFKYYEAVFGKDNIKLAVVDEDDTLDFVKEDDIVLLRTASKPLIRTIGRKGIKSTAELIVSYEQASDKKELAKLLHRVFIPTPKQYELDEVVAGNAYFVKPRYGGDNKGISDKCICHTKDSIMEQVYRISESLGQPSVIEDFIAGTECTVACFVGLFGELLTCPIEEVNGEWRVMEGVACVRAEEFAERIFSILALKHHMRVDMRKDKDGNLYVIDVNLIPSLGPNGLFAKCLQIANGIGYEDAVKAVVATAS